MRLRSSGRARAGEPQPFGAFVKHLIPAVTVSILAAPRALACGVCTIAMVDRVIPAIQVWMLLAVGWFLANGVIRSVADADLPFQPRAVGSILLAGFAFVLGGAFAGPFLVLPLAVPPTIGYFRNLRLPSGRRSRPVVVVGVLAVVMATGAATYSVYLGTTRSDAQYIAQWGHTAPGRHVFLKLRDSEPESLATYRYLVQHGKSRIVAESAGRIAILGTPSHDIPILQEALRRFAADDSTAEAIGLAIQELRSKQQSPNKSLERTAARSTATLS